MKLLVATDNYAPRYDGISRFLKEVVPALAQEHDVHVVAPDYGPSNDEAPTTKIPIKRLQVGDYHPPKLKPIKIWRLVRQADAVFIQSLGSIGLPALIAARLQNKKVVLFTHAIEWELVPRSTERAFLHRVLPRIIKGLDKLLYGWIDLLVMPADNISELYYWNRIDTKRVIVPLGVDAKEFRPPRSKGKQKERAGLDRDAYVIGYHGRIAHEKDLKTLLRAYTRFRRSNPDVKTHLLVVGDGLREIRDVLEREGVTVTGFVEEPAPLLQAMDVYVMPSTTETTCLSVLEAMSTGLPVVSTPVGYVRDYITDAKNGYFFPERGEYELSRKLEELLDKNQREKIGRKARESITKRFSWDETRKQILDVFERL